MTKAEQARIVAWRLRILKHAENEPRYAAQTVNNAMLVASPIVLAALHAFLDKIAGLNHSGDRDDKLKGVFAIVRCLLQPSVILGGKTCDFL